MQFVAARGDSELRRDRALRRASPSRLGITKLRVTGGEPLVRRDLPVLIRAAGRHSRHSRSGADHQRRAAAGAGRSRSTKPACGASTCTWTRWTASASCRSRGATIWTACWPACARAAGWASTHQAERRGGEEPGGAGHRAAGALRARERIRGALHRVHAARRAGICGTAARCCWRTRSSRRSRARSRR